MGRKRSRKQSSGTSNIPKRSKSITEGLSSELKKDNKEVEQEKGNAEVLHSNRDIKMEKKDFLAFLKENFSEILKTKGAQDAIKLATGESTSLLTERLTKLEKRQNHRVKNMSEMKQQNEDMADKLDQMDKWLWELI